MLDGSLPIRFATLNTNVSAGGFYLINGHLGLSGSVDWYVIGTNNSYLNYFYLHAGLSIFF